VQVGGMTADYAAAGGQAGALAGADIMFDGPSARVGMVVE
jgi:hypothetical protein